MNVFKREVKANSKSLIIWTVLSMMLSGVAFWEYGLADSAQQMSDIFAGFPDIINTVFGVSPLGVNDVVGYSALVIYYIYFIGLAYALILGSKMVQKEIDDNTSEFLFTKPISRTKVYYEKSSVAKINMLIFTVANFAITTVMMLGVNDPVYTDNEIIKYMALSYFGLYLLMVTTYFVTVSASCLYKNKRASLMCGGFFILYSYASSILILSFEKLNDFTIISPWRYFSVDVIVNDGFSIGLMIILIVIASLEHYFAIKGINNKSF